MELGGLAHRSSMIAAGGLSTVEQNERLNIRREPLIATKLLRAGFGKGAASIEDGAKTSEHLVDDKRVAGVTGKYFVDCREQHSSKYSLESRVAQELRERSMELLLHYL